MKRFFVLWMVFIHCVYAEPTALEVNAAKSHVLKTLPLLEGWCSKEKATQFIDFILEQKPEVWVEIGVFGGSSLFPVASAFKLLGKGTVIAIDPWDKLECIKYYDPVKDRVDLKWWGNLNLNQIYTGYLGVLKTHGLEPYCKTLRMTSEKAATLVEVIDVLHLDGNHAETATTQDVKLYLPKVRPGGFIWMNDSSWSARQEGVELLLEACDVVRVIDNGNCLLLKKRAAA